MDPTLEQWYSLQTLVWTKIFFLLHSQSNCQNSVLFSVSSFCCSNKFYHWLHLSFCHVRCVSKQQQSPRDVSRLPWHDRVVGLPPTLRNTALEGDYTRECRLWRLSAHDFFSNYFIMFIVSWSKTSSEAVLYSVLVLLLKYWLWKLLPPLVFSDVRD